MPDTELSIIPQPTKVYYDTHANLAAIAAAGQMRVEDLAYATDRKILYRWSGAALEAISNPPAIFPMQNAFDGTAPTAWTLLNLSAIIGSINAYVYLFVENSVAAQHTYHFRGLGITEDGIEVVVPASSNKSVGFIQANTLGRIEWKCDAAVACKIDLLGYIR